MNKNFHSVANKKVVPFCGVGLILVSGLLSAAPVITDVQKDPSGAVLGNGDTFSVDGKNFGAKNQGPAVLYDHSDLTWENGTPNDHHMSFSDMELIKRPNLDPDTLWVKPSVPDEINSGVLVAKSRATRDGKPGAQYYAKGNNNFLGWPTANGGFNVSSDSNKLYSSFWMKIPYDLGIYYAIPGNADSHNLLEGGDESYGEKISIEGIEGYGRIISYEPDLGSLEHGWIFFEPPTRRAYTSLTGKRIEGVESGASVVFPENSSKGKFDDHGFLIPRGKYARYWSVEEGNGYRFTFGNNAAGGMGSNLYNHKFSALSPIPGQWNLFEYELNLGDLATGELPSLKVRINGEIFVEGNEQWGADALSYVAENGLQDEGGLTIALLGINDFMPVPFSFDLDDIYMDDSLQRVMVCSRASMELIHSGEGSCELQRISKWSLSSIEVKAHLGSLDSDSDDLFVYVFDENGTPNSSGYPLNNVTLSSPKPPSPVTVD